MKSYWVTYDWGIYICESVRVYADNKREVRKIMKAQFGAGVKIREIEEEGENK